MEKEVTAAIKRSTITFPILCTSTSLRPDTCSSAVRFDQVLLKSRQQKGHLLACVRAELAAQLLMLCANSVTRQKTKPQMAEALYLAAFSRKSNSARRKEPTAGHMLYDLCDKLAAYRKVVTGPLLY